MPREEQVVGLDELFDDGPPVPRREQPPRPARRPARPFDWRWWVRRLFVAVALTTVAYALLYIFGYQVSYPLMLLTIVAVQVMREMLVQVRSEELPATVTGIGLEPVGRRPERPGPPRSPGRRDLRDAIPTGDGILLAVAKWDDRFVWGERDPNRFSAVVVPRFTDLVDARLRQRHGITLAGHPEQARKLVGEDLWKLLHYTPSRVPSPQDIASIVAKVEAL
ncbi:hypothetical protein [Dactylosporangium matsuzakiense]|uniref:Uncharacterized protein n=1 Tax=Dactylosporangium matsuzakiense TaxID=53360 RepID=A0A9W6NKC7_9ACTN|nr:hypothetical protein [Dactylosporangium matsuzakiense]UWZ44222.1 hypothetical protein Dmats_43750 [Dactylosporangium matsuzakiense]GLK99636.1 hypothetical protein GCM10017581_013770 [Dactylosporangium matsuzakiense]